MAFFAHYQIPARRKYKVNMPLVRVFVKLFPVRAQVDEHFSRKKGRATCGTTATTVIQIASSLYIAHCGDSRAILVSKTSVVPLTRDHKPVDADEAERIRVCTFATSVPDILSFHLFSLQTSCWVHPG
jgi:serine/threonine protein phosphatase PrpC